LEINKAGSLDRLHGLGYLKTDFQAAPRNSAQMPHTVFQVAPFTQEGYLKTHIKEFA